jgi:Uma2 family endonuclease
MTIATYKWSVERYHQGMIDAGLFDDQSVELLRGEIVIMSPEREPHAYYNSEVGDYLRVLLQGRAKIRGRDLEKRGIGRNIIPRPRT